jgi:hypothetical protein
MQAGRFSQNAENQTFTVLLFAPGFAPPRSKAPALAIRAFPAVFALLLRLLRESKNGRKKAA